MCIFDPREFSTNEEELPGFGEQEITVLTNFYGKEKINTSDKRFEAIVDKDETFKEWQIIK